MTSATTGLLLLLALLASSNHAFQINTASRSNICRRNDFASLFSVIKSEDVDFKFDEGAGGVRLAQESVIKITGQVSHAPGKAEPKISDLMRYTSLTAVSESAVDSSPVTVLGTGIGVELYKDPGETASADITLAPPDAVRDCLMGVGSALEYDTVHINFCGGNDAQVLEVLAATKEMVLDLDVKTKAKIAFSSISHSSLPEGKSFITVVGLPEDVSTGGLKGVERALASGEVFFCNGQYWTVTDDDINTAIA